MLSKRLVVGKYAVNCYIVMCEETKELMVIDPGAQAKVILKEIEALEGTLKYIALTHGHGDHIGAVEALKDLAGGQIIAMAEEQDMLLNPDYNESIRIGDAAVSFDADYYVKPHEVLKLGKLEVKCLPTPGHTKGGMTYAVGKALYTGDTLFLSSVGRTDLYGGNMQTLINSITSELMVYPDDTLVFPGHGAGSTIGYERDNNPFL